MARRSTTAESSHFSAQRIVLLSRQHSCSQFSVAKQKLRQKWRSKNSSFFRLSDIIMAPRNWNQVVWDLVHNIKIEVKTWAYYPTRKRWFSSLRTGKKMMSEVFGRAAQFHNLWSLAREARTLVRPRTSWFSLRRPQSQARRTLSSRLDEETAERGRRHLLQHREKFPWRARR